MSDKAEQAKRIDPLIRDWKRIQTIITARVNGKTRKQIAESVKLTINRLDMLVRRMRWTSQQTSGVGSVERNVATEFVAAWEDAGGRAQNHEEPYRPMSGEEGRAVSDAIRIARGLRAEEPPDELVPPGIASLWPVESGA